MRSTRLSRELVIGYVCAVGLSSGLLLALLALRWGAPDLRELAFFWLILAIGDRLEVEATVRGIPQAGLRLRKPAFSAGFLVVLVCAFATDPPTTALLGLASALVPSGWRGVLRGVFNGAQTAVYGGVASVCYFMIGERLGGGASAGLIAALGAACFGVALNTSLVGAVLALERRRRFLAVIRELAWPTPNSLAFSFLAFLVAILYADAGASAVLLILAPLFVLRQARQGKLEVESARAGALNAFVSAVDLKSPWTYRHSANVASVALAIHRLLGANEDELEKRYYGALLHDIGKVAVSGRLLSKRGALSDEEWDEMRRHPTAGAMALADVEFLTEVVPEILYHHERLDGKGYPSGLKGDDIPFEARVLAVADTFESLVNARPYRDACSQEDAIQELRRCAGTQLDSLAVEALAEVVDQGHELPVTAVPAVGSAQVHPRRLAQGA